MEQPSPFKSKPHSAASTPKTPSRPSTIGEAETIRRSSKICDVETSWPKEEIFDLGEIKDASSPDAMQAGTAYGRADNQQCSINDSPDKKASELSEFEEREYCCTYKVRNSLVLCCGFLCFGASMAILGPTILEMGCLIGSDVGSMSWVFFSQSCSALIGAICSGFIIDRYNVNYNIYLATVMTIHAIALAILPFSRRLGSLLTVTCLHGLFGGFQDTATNLRMIIMHGQEVPPYLQTLFFFYGAGAFLSPLIAGNFLSDECNKGDIDVVSEFAFARRKRHNGIGKTYWFSRTKDSGLSLSAENPIQHEIIRISSSNVHYSFWIIALLHILVTAALLYFHCVERKEKQRRVEWELSNSAHTEDESQRDSASYAEDTMSSIRSEIDPEIKGPVICITVWIAMMVFISDGLQGSFGAYIYTYAIKSGNGITPDDAAYLNSLFWGSVALGRLFAIFVSIYVSPRIMLFFDIVGCLASTIVMYVLPHYIVSLWVGTATFGLCLSNIFPTSVSMAEGYFRLTGTITCIFVVCSGSGEMTIPLIIGKLFDVIGPSGFLAISCILCFAAVGIYIAVILTGRGLIKKQNELVLSRSDSEGTLDETKALLSEDEQRPKDGQLELHMTSSSSGSSEKR